MCVCVRELGAQIFQQSILREREREREGEREREEGEKVNGRMREKES